MRNAMTLPTVAVANYFIGKSLETGRELTPMKLIKLVYIAHGWYLGNTDQPLIGEAVQAWKYGPVIQSLYDHFKRYRDSQITRMEPVFSKDGFILPTVPDDTKPFLDSVWNAYSNFSGIQLSTICHQRGTPWYQVWVEQGGSQKQGAMISNDIIRDHYRQLIAARAGERAANAAA